MIKVAFLVAGFKGMNFLEKIHQDCHVAFVSSYAVKGTLSKAFTHIKELCSDKKYNFVERHKLNQQTFKTADIIFVAGWQYLIDNASDKFVVLHDSLLPKFRGFSPTITALVLGERKIGVSAIKPVKYLDCGPVYGQAVIEIDYPIKIKKAYLLLAEDYVKIAANIINKLENGEILASCEQDETVATYSIWRDELDYFIDWKWDAEKICRFIDAVGWPYQGAKASYESKIITVDEANVIRDLKIENRSPGKIWSVENGRPEVVCGRGMIELISTRDSNGSDVEFKKMRTRLGSLPA